MNGGVDFSLEIFRRVSDFLNSSLVVMWGCLSWKYSFMEAATTLPHLYIGGPFLTMLKVSLISSLEKFFLEFDVYSYSETDMYDSMIDSEELLFYGFMWKLNLRCG